MFIKFDKKIKEAIKNGKFSFPYRTKFQITNHCNAKCNHCSLWKQKSVFINEDIVIRTIRDLSKMGCKEIDFTGGEATTHPSLIKFIQETSSLGINPRLNTNGFNVDMHMAERLVIAGIKKYAVSIDSPCSEEHNSIRNLNDLWERAINSINYINQYRKEFNKEIRIVLYSIVTNKNYKKIDKLFELKKIINFDEINLIPIKDINNKHLFLSKEQAEEYYFKIVPNLLKEYKRYHLKGIMRSVEHTFGFEDNFEFIPEGKYTNNNNIPCYTSQFYTYIKESGDVVPCCVAPHHMKEEYIMGNIYEDPITVIWNSEKYKKLRMSLRKPCFEICKCCSATLFDFNINTHKQVT